MKNQPNLYWIALVHFKNPLNLFISKQKATKFYLILNPIAWNSITDLDFQDLSSGGETEMLLLVPNKQRYHSDDFKKQGETQKFLSAIGCVILKLVGTSCGLGLSRKATKIWQNLQILFEISIKNCSNFKNLNYLLLAFYSNNIINYIAIRIWKNETIQSVIKNY